MFQRFSRSWDLMKASAYVLYQDKELLVFPLISAGALLVVMLCFALPVLGLGALDGLKGGGAVSTAMYVVGFLFYFCQYFVIFFFNSALVAAAMIRLDGGEPTLHDGLNAAKAKIGVIAGYAAIAATVGMILRIIQERVGFVGKIIVGILGVGWTMATFMVVPVLVHRDVGPVEAIKESAYLLKETWGENAIGQAGLGLAFGFIFFAVMVASAFLIFVAVLTHSAWIIGFAVLMAILLIACTALIQAALSGIYAAALYRYATTGKGTTGFPAEKMQLAFAPK